MALAKQNPPLKNFLRAHQLAERFGVSPKTIFRWASLGMIKKYGPTKRTIRFDEAEVFAIFKQTADKPLRKARSGR